MAGGVYCEHCNHSNNQQCAHCSQRAPTQHYGPLGPPTQHYGPIAPPTQHYGPMEPEGELVTVHTEANPNYRLTIRDGGAVLAFKNSRDVNQQWIKVDVGAGKGGFLDKDGQPGFVLVNKATGVPLKHGHKATDVVTTGRQVFGMNSLEGAFIWSLGKKDEGHGYKGMRVVTNTGLNLEADHADKAHGGVRDGNRLLISAWKPQENFKWKIEPVEAVVEH